MYFNTLQHAYDFVLLFRASDTRVLPVDAQNIRDEGIIPFAVGVGGADVTELRVSTE